MKAEATLVIALKAKQRELKLSDREMALRLRVSRPLWTRVKNGDYPISGSASLLKGIMSGFPEFTAEAISFMREDVTTVNLSGTASTSADDEAGMASDPPAAG